MRPDKDDTQEFCRQSPMLPAYRLKILRLLAVPEPEERQAAMHRDRYLKAEPKAQPAVRLAARQVELQLEQEALVQPAPMPQVPEVPEVPEEAEEAEVPAAS